MLRLNNDDDDKGLNIDQLFTMFGLTQSYDIRFSYVYHVKVIGSLLLICFKFLIRSDVIKPRCIAKTDVTDSFGSLVVRRKVSG